MTKSKIHTTDLKRFLFGVAIFIMATVNLCAQNNPYKIRNDLYRIYVRAYNARKNAKGVQLADSMYHKAVACKDTKAQCLALTIPFLHQFTKPDYEALERTGKALQDKALQTGHTQFFYFVMSNKVAWMMNNNMMDKVLDYIKSMQKFAESHKHNYGIYTGYRCLALVQMKRGDALQAIESYKKALSFGLANMPDQDMAQNYRRMAECYANLEDWNKVLECVDKGMPLAKTQQTKSFLQLSKCEALFHLKRDKDLLVSIAQAEKDNGATGGTNTDEIYKLHIYKKIVEENWSSALKDIDKMSSYDERLRMYVAYYMRRNDFKTALSYYKKIITLRDDMSAKVAREDLASMNAKYNNQELEMEKQQAIFQQTKLQLANTQLTLENSSLELNKTRASEHLAKLNADNYLLSLNNKQLETKRLKDSLAAQQERREAKEKEMRFNNTILLTLLSVAFIILALTAIYSRRNRIMSKKLKFFNNKLRKTVAELTVAKEKAQQSDKMKTMFIQNMSHEIRTPLNAIVGFTEVMMEMGSSLPEEEKKEMCKTISNNSELLSTLINDILDMTSLDSGKYVMKYDNVNINDLCRQALKTVAHRKAEGVVLNFESDIPEDITINTDANRVKQVLINMLTNAEKNTTEGTITLKCSLNETPGYLTFSVADTGIGIPADKAEEIFERFKKLDKFKQGSGLGLNISRTIAEKLGGSIYVDKHYTGGARFVFTIKA